MSPRHAAKGGRRWRYYVTQAVLQGRKHEAGSVARVPALKIERWVAKSVRAASSSSKRQGWQELHQPKARCHGASTDAPTAPQTDYAVILRAAIERSSCLERQSRSSLPRGWRVTTNLAS